MSSLRRNRVFDPVDLEIIERVYEAAWAEVEADIFRDTSKDDERKTALREWAFVLAGTHPVDFDTLSEKLATIIPKPWITPSTRSLAAHPHKSARKSAMRRPILPWAWCRHVGEELQAKGLHPVHRRLERDARRIPR